MREGPPSEQRPATKEEIEEAIQALTPAQLIRLEKIAWLMHRTLGSRGAGRNECDLLSDSIIAVLEGRRKWVKDNCDFMTFIKGAMRSLASHIRDRKATDAFDEIAWNPDSAQDSAEDSIAQIPTKAPDPERRLHDRDFDRQVREQFKDDAVGFLVYEAFLEKRTPSDIRSCLGITEHEYHAAAKRLRRAVRRLLKEGSR